MSELIQIEEIAQVKQGRYTSPSELSTTPTEQAKVPVWGANGILGYTQTATYEEAQPLVTCRGNGCGLIQWSGGRAHISNNAMAILLKEESRDSSKYLYYSLLHSDFSDVTTGSAQPQITMGHLNKKEIFWHSDPNERAQVAHILGTLDDKIELNRKTNETLEAIAKALFKSWFVDFDPVRAKAGGRPTGLPDEISDLFPDSFEDSELGEIPRGWEVGFLGDHTDLIKGRSYKSDELNQSTTALVTLKSFQRNGGYRSDGLKQFTGEYKEQQVVKPGELVVALTDVTQAADVIGRPAIVKSDSFCSKLVASLDVGIIRPRRDGRLATPYLYSLMLTPGYVQHVLGYTSGTTVLHLAKDATAKFPLPIPGASISNQYCLLAGSILHQIDASDRQSELLAKTRDALLPKLISGEIRIPDAERMLEEVCV
jgi:type I restriction enzyme S subunit